MGDWKTFVNKTKELLTSKDISAAKEEIAIGLGKFPNQPNLLLIATDVYRALNNYEKSLEYAELLITHHPDKWQGYGCAARLMLNFNPYDKQTAKEKLKLDFKKSRTKSISLLSQMISIVFLVIVKSL